MRKNYTYKVERYKEPYDFLESLIYFGFNELSVGFVGSFDEVQEALTGIITEDEKLCLEIEMVDLFTPLRRYGRSVPYILSIIDNSLYADVFAADELIPTLEDYDMVFVRPEFCNQVLKVAAGTGNDLLVLCTCFDGEEVPEPPEDDESEYKEATVNFEVNDDDKVVGFTVEGETEEYEFNMTFDGKTALDRETAEEYAEKITLMALYGLGADIQK